MHIHAYACTYTHLRLRLHRLLRSRTYTCTYTHMHAHTRTCAFACISSSVVERTYIDALSSTQMHVRRTSAAPACCTAPPCGSYPTPPAPQPPRAPPRPHQTRAGPPCPRHGRSSSDEAWRLWRDPQQLATWPQPTAAPGMSPNQPRRRMRGDAGKGLHVVGPPHLGCMHVCMYVRMTSRGPPPCCRVRTADATCAAQ